MKKKIALVLALGLFGVVSLKAPFVFAAADADTSSGTVKQETVKPAGSDAKTETAKSSEVSGEDAELEKMRLSSEEAKKITVAIVNDATISMFELVRMMNRVAPKYVKEGEEITPEITAQVKKDALDRLILDELAIQQSYTKGVTIEKEAIDKVITNVRESLGSEEELAQYMKGRNLTEEQLRAEIERSRRREIIMAKEVYGKVKVNEDDIKKEYQQYKKDGRLKKADDFIIKEVLLMKGESDEAEKKKAEALLAEIKKHDGDMGKLVLDGTFITRRMQITKDRYPVIYDMMSKMKKDEMSGVVKDGGAYHIFMVVNNEPARELTLDESRGFIENRLRVPAQDARKAEWEKELRKDAKIEIMLEKVEQELKEKADKAEAENAASKKKTGEPKKEKK